MTNKKEERDALKKWTRIGALAGVLLAIVCHVVPPRYQAACNIVAQVIPHACGN